MVALSLVSPSTLILPALFQRVPDATLAAVLDQSVDCVKLIGIDGTILYMNRNGQCAMEIDDFCAIAGQPWASIWPDDARLLIVKSLVAAQAGNSSRFDAFCPTARGTPRWWDVSVSPVNEESGELIGYLSVSRDVTERVLADQATQAAADEMRHRLKNGYAMVGGLLSAFARGVPHLEEFARDMIGRLNALATAQTLSASSAPSLFNVSELIPALVSPFANPGCPIDVEELAGTKLDQGQADAIALVLGELAVNSTKHGALSDQGRITVRAVENAGTLRITWAERSTRRVAAQNRDGGQGFTLMRRIVAARHGEMAVAWQDFGLDVAINFDLGPRNQ